MTLKPILAISARHVQSNSCINVVRVAWLYINFRVLRSNTTRHGVLYLLYVYQGLLPFFLTYPGSSSYLQLYSQPRTCIIPAFYPPPPPPPGLRDFYLRLYYNFFFFSLSINSVSLSYWSLIVTPGATIFSYYIQIGT